MEGRSLGNLGDVVSACGKKPASQVDHLCICIFCISLYLYFCISLYLYCSIFVFPCGKVHVLKLNNCSNICFIFLVLLCMVLNIHLITYMFDSTLT